MHEEWSFFFILGKQKISLKTLAVPLHEIYFIDKIPN